MEADPVGPEVPLDHGAKIGDIVLVRWVDSTRQADWTYGTPVLKRFVHESVGFLSHKTAEVVNVRPHRMIDGEGDEQHFGDMTIPLCAVQSIEVITSSAASSAPSSRLDSAPIRPRPWIGPV